MVSHLLTSLATGFSSYQKVVDAKLCLLSCPVTPVASNVQKRKQDQGWINSVMQPKEWNRNSFLQKLSRSLSHFTASPPPCWLKTSNYIIGSAAQYKGRVPHSDPDHSVVTAVWPQNTTTSRSWDQNSKLTQLHRNTKFFYNHKWSGSIIHWDNDMSGRTTALGRTAKYLCSVATQRKWFAKLTATIVFNLFQFVDC